MVFYRNHNIPSNVFLDLSKHIKHMEQQATASVTLTAMITIT